MKRTSLIISIVFLVLILLTSCNWPLGGNPAPAVQGTPNATLTALFDTSLIIPATITPPVIATLAPATATVEVPTATSTNTPEPTITNTVAPTATFTAAPPTATVYVPPAQRENAQLVAMYLSTAPVQDGTYAEWVEKTNKYSMPYFAWGKANWVDYADAEGKFAVGWDNNNLYIGVKMVDDVYTQKNTGDQMYVGDAVEILIDTDLMGDFYTTSYSNDDYHLGLSAGDASAGVSAGAYLWNPSSVAGPRSQVVMSYSSDSATIHRIEAAIPWSMIGVSPYNGMRLGFAICFDDNDNTTDYNKVTMLSSASGLLVFNPTTWGELVLVK